MSAILGAALPLKSPDEFTVSLHQIGQLEQHCDLVLLEVEREISHPARAVAGTLFPHVVWKALLADATARSTSTDEACENSRRGLPFAGLTVGNVALSEEALHSLSLTVSAWS